MILQLGRAMLSRGRSVNLLLTFLSLVAGCTAVPAFTTPVTTVFFVAAPATAVSPGALPGCNNLAGQTFGEIPTVVAGPNNGLEPSPAGGEPLVIQGVVGDRQCQSVADATVTVWHTDGAGDYGPGEDCCYYWGTVQTDSNGVFRIETVRPAVYRGGGPAAHIHVEVIGDSTKMTELVFSDDPGLPASAGSDGTTVLDVMRVTDGQQASWYGEVVLVMS